MERVRIKGELVSFRNSSNILLDGILYEPEALEAAGIVIHVHGSYGNFYQNQFLRHMAKAYSEIGFAFLAFNLQAHDGFGEGYGSGEDFEYVGGAISRYSTYLVDIDAAIAFGRAISNNIVLQGHSMGCDKVVGYMLRRNTTYSTILLSPSDSYGLQSEWLRRQFGISVEEQLAQLKLIKKVTPNENHNWIAYNSYGLYYTDFPHYLPVTSDALLSILEGESFWTFNISKATDYFVDTNVFVYLGGTDELVPGGARELMNYISKRFRSVHPMIISDAEHMLENVAERVSAEIVNWLVSLRNRGL